MKTKRIAIFTIALLAADVLQTAYAGEAVQPASGAPVASSPTQLERAEVRAPAIAENQVRTPTYPEFGAGSHIGTLSTRTREEVKAEAREHTAHSAHTYFSY